MCQNNYGDADWGGSHEGPVRPADKIACFCWFLRQKRHSTAGPSSIVSLATITIQDKWCIYQFHACISAREGDTRQPKRKASKRPLLALPCARRNQNTKCRTILNLYRGKCGLLVFVKRRRNNVMGSFGCVVHVHARMVMAGSKNRIPS